MKDVLISVDNSIRNLGGVYFDRKSRNYLNSENIGAIDLSFEAYTDYVEFVSESFKPLLDIPIKDAISLLCMNALQQFCFWVPGKSHDFRTEYTSSSLFKVLFEVVEFNKYNGLDRYVSNYQYALKEHIKMHALTLREERLRIADIEFDTSISDIKEFVHYLYELDEFQSDIFRKKANLFIMSLVQYGYACRENARKSKILNDTIEFLIDLRHIALPAIDYQIPKVLFDKNILKLNANDLVMIEGGIPFIENSEQEIKYRMSAYATCIDIQNICLNSYVTQDFIDYVLFKDRSKSKAKYHLCLTTNY